MEDQQPDSGDLTTEAAEETPTARPRRWQFWRRRAESASPQPESEPEDAPASETASEPEPKKPVGKAGRTAKPVEPVVEDPADEGETAESDSSDVSDAEDTADEEPVVLVPHQAAGKRLTIAAAAAAALFVAAGAFAGAMAQPYLADRALVHTKVDIARTAANAITTLWTYTPEDMESLPDRSAKFLSGDFAHEYRRYIDAIVATNKQAQVSNNTEVMGTAVESVGPTEATAIVYTNSVATSPASKNIPSLRYLSYRLTMERRGGDWLINRMTAITSLDLTPRL
ncbi:mammalian cell entry protein [Mycobacterium hubeiense]|uniref:mammalian cell entry protein n=1 Tax=Mycobacterium hubeiense TaxID=1867256 RepID=UPI000C7F7388|nr:mammalian cell entry protein [Mycobacterium sp. QGD 101]